MIRSFVFIALSAFIALAAADTATFQSDSFTANAILPFGDVSGKVSIQFKTTDANGLILYQDGLVKDFFSLELVNTRVRLRWNCGSGAAQLESATSGLNDGNWHTIVATLLYKDASLSVDGDALQVGTTPGSSVSVNTTGPAFVGGVPAGYTFRPSSVTQFTFTGCIRQFWYNSDLINFNNALWFNNVALGGCGDVPVHVASFNAMDNSTVALPRMNLVDGGVSVVSFSFRTLDAEGLLIYQNGIVTDFLSFELASGSVVFKYNPGNAVATLTSAASGLNDNKWHKVVATLAGKVGTLSIDGGAVQTVTAGGSLINVNTTGNFFVGGLLAGDVPKPNTITQTRFTGCIRDLLIPNTRTFQDFKFGSVSAVAVTECKSESVARFRPFNSYVQFPSMFDNAVSDNQVSFSFRTTDANGLFFYQHGLVKDFVAAQLINGRVVFKWNPGSGAGVITSTASGLNDGKWHTVVAGWLQTSGHLSVDGGAPDTGSSVGPNISTNSTIPLLVGGIDPAFTPYAGAISYTTFDGCIAHFRATPFEYEFDFQADAVKSNNVDLCGSTTARFGPSSVGTFAQIVPTGLGGSISLSFSTSQANGLLLYQPGLMGVDFLSLEVVDGRVVFKWNPGSGAGVLSSAGNAYNDDRIHHVVATWNAQAGSLTVDAEFPATGTSVGSLVAVNTTGLLYVGGLSGVTPQPHSITQTVFIGCISDLHVEGANGYLDFEYDSLSSSYVSLKCQSEIVHTDASSFVEFSRIDPSDGHNSIVLDFRTTSTNGLLLYQRGIFTDFLSLEIIGGQVVFKWNPGSGAGVLTHPLPVSDGDWHTVSAEWGGNFGILIVDNVSSVTGFSQGALIAVNTTGALYMAGLNGVVPQANSITQTTYEGCVGNLFFNGKLFEISHSLSQSVLSTTCPETYVMKVEKAPVFAGSSSLFGSNSGSGSSSSSVLPIVATVSGVALLAVVAVVVIVARRRNASTPIEA